MSAIGSTFMKVRGDLHRTREDVAGASGLSIGTITDIEDGAILPSQQEAQALCDALDQVLFLPTEPPEGLSTSDLPIQMVAEYQINRAMNNLVRNSLRPDH